MKAARDCYNIHKSEANDSFLDQSGISNQCRKKIAEAFASIATQDELCALKDILSHQRLTEWMQNIALREWNYDLEYHYYNSRKIAWE